MSNAQIISQYQPILQSIAYNIVRCREDAEDIVQETFVKWLSVDSTKIQNTKAYLIKAVTHNCLNHLETIKRRKTEYLESPRVKELLGKLQQPNLREDLEAEVAKALRLIHTKLEPLERAVYLLREVFDFDYDALQEALEKKKENCRQILCRARQKLADESARLHLDLPDTTQMIQSFRKACDWGHPMDLVKSLKEETQVQKASKRAN